eukprot:10639338-Heterocapsa_arctica.AAC.1
MAGEQPAEQPPPPRRCGIFPRGTVAELLPAGTVAHVVPPAAGFAYVLPPHDPAAGVAGPRGRAR